MRIYKSKWFNKWAEKERLTDNALKGAVKELEDGLIDADLGGQVFKKRVAIKGQGKSAGLRTIIAFKRMAKELFGYNRVQLNKAVSKGSLIEVK